MRRFRFPLLALLTTIVAMLFFGDFLTGREHMEFQDPYSRMTRVIEQKYGFASRDELQPNAMTDYYFNQLRQKRGGFNWQPAPNSFYVQRVTGRRMKDTAPIAPVIDLDPNREVDFLRALPNDKVRLAVIHSMYHDKAAGTDATAQKKNQRLMAQEADRMGSVLQWVLIDSKDPTTSHLRWWQANSPIFGLTPEGDALPAPAAVTVH